MKHRISFVCLLALVALAPRAALANFHVMEVEQIVAGVGGTTSAQAITLRQRAVNQNVLFPNAQIRVWDANGANPVVVSTFSGAASNPADGTVCTSVLLATSGMTAKTQPAVVPDFSMSAIPDAYLAKGSLTFESTGGTFTWWRVSWGGYTSTDTVAAGTNDSDGHTNPAFASALPTTGVQALHFTPACGTLSTNTAADYGIVSGTVNLVKNSGTTFAVKDLLPVPALPGSAQLLLPGALGLALLAFAIRRRRAS
jgi:hypothetical protein